MSPKPIPAGLKQKRFWGRMMMLITEVECSQNFKKGCKIRTRKMTGTNQMFLALYPQADNFFSYTNDQGWLSPASESICLFHKQTVQIQIDTCPP